MSATQARNFTWFRNIQQSPKLLSAAQCTTQKSCKDVAQTPICPLVKSCPSGAVVNLVVRSMS